MEYPYDILGMDESSDFESLERRYKELKSQYLEQMYLPGDEGKEGAEKLTKLESAWREIKDEQKRKTDEKQNGSGFDAVEKAIKEGNYEDAQNRLDNMDVRNAQWHYYQSLLYYKREWLNDSRTHLAEAVRLEPSNQKYSDALKRLDSVIGNSKTRPQDLGAQPQQSGVRQGGDCLTSCCMAYMCADCCSCLCRCLG